MADHSELKKLAEAAPEGPWFGPEYAPGTSHVFDVDLGTLLAYESIDSEKDACLRYVAAANPAAVLALIAENERLGLKADSLEFAKWSCQVNQAAIREAGHETIEDLAAERDQLRIEVEALRKDKDRLDALEANFWDVRHISTQSGPEGDTTESIEIVGSWMDAPHERVIGENYNENLRAAIDQAMKAPAYPPARPEYEYEYEIPNFGGGNGNKARRRAGELGIDYDAAMGKGEQP